MHVGNMQVSNEIMHVRSKTMHVSSCKVVVKLSTYIILYCMHVSTVIIISYRMHVGSYPQVIHINI